jgi:hypothetical protein
MHIVRSQERETSSRCAFARRCCLMYRIVSYLGALAKERGRASLGFNRVSRLRIGISLCPASTTNCRVTFLLNILRALLPYYTLESSWYSYPYFLYGFIFRLVFPLTWFDFPCRATVPAVYFLPAVNQSIYSTGKLNWIVVSLFLTQQNCISHRFRPPRPNGWFWSNFFFPSTWLASFSVSKFVDQSIVCASNHWKKTRQKKRKEIPGSLTPGHHPIERK